MERALVLPHTSFEARGLHPLSFSIFESNHYRYSSSHPVKHVAWSCDGRKLGAVGMDHATRFWDPEQPVPLNHQLAEYLATKFTGGHTGRPDHMAFDPTHPDLFCTSSTGDKMIVFWDTCHKSASSSYGCIDRQKRLHDHPPLRTQYSPDGRSLLFITSGHQLLFLAHRDRPREAWFQPDSAAVTASKALFSHTGNSILALYHTSNAIRLHRFPSLLEFEAFPAHIGGCMALALDPRGMYVASGGADSIVNLYDPFDWLPVRTITTSDHGIRELSFSHDGEYLAIASRGNYVDVAAVESASRMSRIPTLCPPLTVAWHPSQSVLAYCGQNGSGENVAGSEAFISALTFGS
ncbi:WD40-repeat-containing domain protein [Coprinopsis sp. MPI-PUGE-AT-0042]|nr:WD40-repeat-containing domain protein [Coprinopsis sp. MPI-PUGE-AT-0042]